MGIIDVGLYSGFVPVESDLEDVSIRCTPWSNGGGGGGARDVHAAHITRAKSLSAMVQGPIKLSRVLDALSCYLNLILQSILILNRSKNLGEAPVTPPPGSSTIGLPSSVECT